MAQPNDPIDVFADVARALAEHDSLTDTLDRIGTLAVETVPGAEYAAVSVVRGRREVESVAATDAICRRVDDVQYETSEGPCLDAIRETDVVQIDDLADTDRWPEFAQRAADIGIRSMLSFRLFVQDDLMGALNLYARRVAAFTDESVRLGQVFAAHAAVAWEHAKENEGLHAAIETRQLIGQAQGILMAQQRLTPAAAFDQLRERSQHRNIKLREVARAVVETGSLPDA